MEKNPQIGEMKDCEYIPLSDERIAGLTKMATAVGARIHVLRRVRVQQDCDWHHSIDRVSPSTPMNYNVRKPEVSVQYPPVSQKTVEKDIVLLNYPESDGNWDKAITWSQCASLKPTNPREVNAVGEQYSTLNDTFVQHSMYVVAPVECAFGGLREVCYVWWNDSDRGADMNGISYFGDSSDWFAFSE